MNNETLVGKTVCLFLDGGWQISGKVAGQEADKIILDKDGELFLVFKNKVSFLQILHVRNVATKIEEFSQQKDKVKHQNLDLNDEGEFPENGISYSETFMNIPGSLLGRPNDQEIDDLSISFKGTDNKNNRISFKVDDDS